MDNKTSTYQAWTVPRLKAELARRGAVTTGRKHDLVERLEAYDRNLDFRGPVFILPPPVLPNWPKSGFKQLTSQSQSLIPCLSEAHMTGYFRLRLAGDSQCVGNMKALDKGRLMFEGGRVDACSICPPSDSSACFFTGIVRAAMKKKVSYNVRMKVDSAGEVLNSDCECPAGKGPHGTCKHVAAMLYMLIQLKENGELRMTKSCTDELQTFHKPAKTYSGSPVKCVDFPGCKRKASDDPRPFKYRDNPGYGDRVRNLVFNYCSNTGQDLAMRYMYDRVNIQVAALDHSYLERPFTEYWVDQATQVTEVQARDVEQSTRKQHGCSKWHEERRWRITASQFGAVCKATWRRNRSKLCQSMVSPKQLETPALLHGRQFEAVAIQAFQQEYKVEVQPVGLVVHPAQPYLAATPDGLVGDDFTVEVKCPYRGRMAKITPGPSFPFLTTLNNKIYLKQNSNYYFQVQGQLAATGRKQCYFVVYTFKDLFVSVISFDNDFWQLSMLPKLQLFYSKYFRPYVAQVL